MSSTSQTNRLPVRSRSLLALFAISTVIAVTARGKDGAEPIEIDGYRIEWTSMNWEGSVELRSGARQWDAVLTGSLYAPQDVRVVGYIAEVTEAADEEGRSLLPSEYEKRWTDRRKNRRRTNRIHRVLGRRIAPGGAIGNLSLSVGSSEIPARRIARVDGKIYAMEVADSAEVEVPVRALPSPWQEAGPGLRFRVENMDRRGQQLLMYVNHTLGEEAGSNENLTRPPYLIDAVTLDAEGSELPTQIVAYGNRGQNQLILNVITKGNESAIPSHVVFKVATAVRERQLPFVLRDIDLGLNPADADEQEDQ